MANSPKVTDAPPTEDGNAAEAAAFSAVRLPAFWQHSPRQWFVHANAVFANSRVTAQSARVNHVVAALDEQGIRAVMDLLGPHASYDTIRARLVDTYDTPSSVKFRELVQPGGGGDQRPSQLLRELRAVLPEGVSDAVLKEFWLLKLPTNVQTVAVSHDCPLDALAARVDRVFDVCRNNRQVDAVRVTHDRIEGLEATIAALTKQVRDLSAQDRTRPSAYTRENSTARGSTAQDRARPSAHSRESSTARGSPAQLARQRSPSPDDPMYCYYHNRYGNRARKCRPPCAAAKRERRGALN